MARAGQRTRGKRNGAEAERLSVLVCVRAARNYRDCDDDVTRAQSSRLIHAHRRAHGYNCEHNLLLYLFSTYLHVSQRPWKNTGADELSAAHAGEENVVARLLPIPNSIRLE